MQPEKKWFYVSIVLVLVMAGYIGAGFTMRATDTAPFCGTCHAMHEAVRAHEAIRLASEYEGERHPDYDELMIRARERTRKGQWFWDMVSAENSVGFHNPAKVLEMLARSQRYSFSRGEEPGEDQYYL